MWRGFRKSAVSETEKVRGGGGPLDNLVVLITSLVLTNGAWKRRFNLTRHRDALRRDKEFRQHRRQAATPHNRHAAHATRRANCESREWLVVAAAITRLTFSAVAKDGLPQTEPARSC
jgi:hypothetical protein